MGVFVYMACNNFLVGKPKSLMAMIHTIQYDFSPFFCCLTVLLFNPFGEESQVVPMRVKNNYKGSDI